MITVVAVFLLAIAYLVATSLAPRTATEFSPEPPTPRPESQPTGVDTITIAAPEGDVWRFVDLETRSLLTLPDTAAWDLAFRRFNVMSSTAAADLGTMPFAEATGPAETVYRAATDSVITRWYHYNYISHLLEPNGHVYALRTREGNEWKLEFLSYYCTGMVAGCVTIRASPLVPLPKADSAQG